MRGCLAALPVLSLIVVITSGCARSEDEARRAAHMKAGLMPVATPSVDLTYVSDQAQVKLLPEQTVSYEPLDSFRGRRGGGQSGDDVEAEKSADAGSESEGEQSGSSPFDAAKSLFSALTGKGAKSGKAAGQASSAKAPPLTLADPKGAIQQIPEHPGGRSGPELEQARDDALKAARAELAKAVFGVELYPGSPLSGELGVTPDADTLELPNVQIVGMKWLDQKRLEVEVQVSAAEVFQALKQKFTGADLNSVEASFDPSKMVEVKAIGELKDKERAATPAGPGERARRASEGAGI